MHRPPPAVHEQQRFKIEEVEDHRDDEPKETERPWPLGRWLQPRALWGWWNDNYTRLAASLAFYTALSLAPLVIIVVGLAGIVTERQQVARLLSIQSERLVGPAGRQVVDAILTTTEPQGGTFAALIGLVTLLLGATAVFSELEAVLDLIWEVKPKPLSGLDDAPARRSTRALR